MNKFVFRPVGQGLFYTGSLNCGRFNFVYDCGTENRQKLIKKEIENYIGEFNENRNQNNRPIIDFVVISHLHQDHFSGLYELTKKAYIKKIYLPFLNYNLDVIRLYLFYDIYSNNNDEENRNENNWEEKDGLYNLMISLYNNDRGNNKENIGGVHFIKNTESVKNSHLLWEFKFFNKEPQSEKVKSINEKCEKFIQNSGCKDMEEFISKNKKNIDVISSAYRKIFGSGKSMNDTSILMLHYPINRIKCILYINYNCYMHFNNCFCNQSMFDKPSNGITLLTGDISFNSFIANELKKFLGGNEIFIFQIPHHGAKENWNSVCKNSIEAKIYVLSFGYGNKYKHPHTNVIDDLMIKNKKYYCVTQNQGFIYYII